MIFVVAVVPAVVAAAVAAVLTVALSAPLLKIDGQLAKIQQAK